MNEKSDAPPSYSESNVTPPLCLRLIEPNKVYTPRDKLRGSIYLKLSPDLYEALAHCAYSCFKVVLQLKCILRGNIVSVVRRDLYYCRKMTILEVNDPFPGDVIGCGCHEISFEVSLETAINSPPNIFDAKFLNGEGHLNIEWNLSSWVEVVNPRNEMEVLHWMHDQRQINFYPIVQAQDPELLVPMPKVSHVLETEYFKLDIRNFPRKVPQKPASFKFDYCFHRKSPFFMRNMDFWLLSVLTAEPEGRLCICGNLVHLLTVTFDRPMPERLLGAVPNCTAAFEWPENFKRTRLQIQHYLHVHVTSDDFKPKSLCNMYIPIDVMPPPSIDVVIAENEQRSSKPPVPMYAQISKLLFSECREHDNRMRNPKGDTETDTAPGSIQLVIKTKKYTVGDTISGHVELTVLKSFIDTCEGYDISSCTLHVRLSCIADLGDERVMYERREELGAAKYPFPEGKMTPACHIIPFAFTLDESIEQYPPTLELKELGDTGCGLAWSVAAWIEASREPGFTELVDAFHAEKKVPVYSSAQDVRWKREWELQQRTYTTRLYDLTILDPPIAYPQRSRKFHISFELKPWRPVYVREVKIELEAKITVRFGNQPEKNYYRKEVLGSVRLNRFLWKRVKLTVKNCTICSERPANFSSQTVDLVHVLLISVKRTNGQDEHRLLVNVRPPLHASV